MKKSLLRIPRFLLVGLIASCASTTPPATTQYQACSSQWYALLDDSLAVSDSQGHGPDLGSMEWRSAVEFKLGIRNNPQVPEPSSANWCSYIDSYVDGYMDGYITD